MSLPIAIEIPDIVVLDNQKLLKYAREVRLRFEVEPDERVWMSDIVAQAAIDGDIELPWGWSLNSDWRDTGYTTADIEKMVEIYADENDEDEGPSWLGANGELLDD